jgi:hypothetical protein
MTRSLRRKRATAVAAVCGSLLLTGGAVAYFTARGSGTGTTRIGTSSGLQISATITPASGGLVPGGNPADVAFMVTNPGDSDQVVNQVSLGSVVAYSDAAHANNISGTGSGRCDTSKFTMAPVTENQSVGPGATTSLPHDGSLLFADAGTDQDGCKSAYIVASFTSN